MKKFIICVLASILSISMIADASIESKTYLGSLKSHETKSIVTQVPEGNHVLEVFNPYYDTKFNCYFIDSASGFTGLTQNNTDHCSGIIHSKFPVTIEVKFTNLDDKNVDYRLTIESVK